MAASIRDCAFDEQARALASGTRWLPSQSDWPRGRAAFIAEFGKPHNLPLQEYAPLAHKSRQQIYKDVAARQLLALDSGRRGLRVPSWQLEPSAQRRNRPVSPS